MKFLILVCVLALLASPYFFAYYEAECLLGWPQAVHLWFDPWLPLVIVIVTSLITFVLSSTLGLLNQSDQGNFHTTRHGGRR
jgi:hypothetical protein